MSSNKFPIHDRLKIAAAKNFWEFLENKKKSRNPKSLCVECLSVLSHYQKSKHPTDNTILTPASFDCQTKYLALATKHGWINNNSITLPSFCPQKWTNDRFRERDISAPPKVIEENIGHEVKNEQMNGSPKSPFKKAKSLKELLSAYGAISEKESEKSKTNQGFALSSEDKKALFLAFESIKKQKKSTKAKEKEKSPEPSFNKRATRKLRTEEGEALPTQFEDYVSHEDPDSESEDSGAGTPVSDPSKENLSHFAKTTKKSSKNTKKQR
jgi:hypothetical protein